MSTKSGGTIYTIAAEGTRFVKIGCTRAPVVKRLKELQTGQPVPLVILATVQIDANVQRIEKQIHRFLAEERH